MLKRIKHSFEKFPDKNALNINGTNFTYSDLGNVVSKVRTYLERNCDGEEKLIGILSKGSGGIGTYGAIYGTLFAGKGYVPVNPSNPVERNNSILRRAGIKTLLCDELDERVKSFAEENGAVPVIINGLPECENNFSLPSVNENDIAYILFTSGSTGIPKGVPITLGNLNSFIEAFLELGFDIGENDRFLQMFELTFDFSVICYMIPLCIGACFYTVPTEGIKYTNVYAVMEEQGITFACLVPTVISYLKPFLNEISLEKIKYSLFCGETLFRDAAEEWSRCIPNGRIINAYGPTEATVFCTTFDWNKYGPGKKTFNGGISIGKEMKNTKAVVVNEELKPAGEGEIGELCLSGAQLMPGYWNDPAKTSEVFFTLITGEKETVFYRTGDLAFIDGDGDLMFCGRKDSQIKIQGFRVELGEIEHYSREILGNLNSAAIAYKNSSGITMIHLFIEGRAEDTDIILRKLRTKIPGYMMPTGITFLSSFPLSGNGKIDRPALAGLLNKRDSHL